MPAPLRVAALVAAATLTTAACTRASRVAPVTVDDALPTAACGEVAVDTGAWIDTFVADLGLEFQRPESFQPQALGARQRPGWGAYEWRRDGGRAEVITAYVLNDHHLRDRETTWARWVRTPGARTCTTVRDGQAARVVVLDASALSLAERAVSDELPRQTVVAEWEFTDDAVVRLTGHARDAAELDTFLAVVRTARFTGTPIPPTQCRPPFDCGLPEE